MTPAWSNARLSVTVLSESLESEQFIEDIPSWETELGGLRALLRLENGRWAEVGSLICGGNK